jgi:hypothetical protein
MKFLTSGPLLSQKGGFSLSLVKSCLALFVAGAGVSQSATTINVDFNTSDGSAGTFSGVAAAPDPGTTWNGVVVGAEGGNPLVGTFTSGALVTSTGAASTVTVSLGNYRNYDANENPASANSGLMTDFVYQQTLGPGGPNSTFAINNLNPAFTYDLYFYAQNAGYSNTATIFTIGAASLTATNTAALGTFVQGTNYVKFTGIAPSGAGTISGTFNDAAAANNAAFNGLQIVQVPEPVVVSMLAAVSLLAFRRRR